MGVKIQERTRKKLEKYFNEKKSKSDKGRTKGDSNSTSSNK